MKNNDETILEILQGHKTAKWPSAKLVKIFIASTKEGKIKLHTIIFVNTYFLSKHFKVDIFQLKKYSNKITNKISSSKNPCIH